MATRLPPITLTYLLQDHKVSVDTLYARDGAIATVAKHLLGIVPVTGEYLEIWPPANRMYCIVVPCFLDLPAFMLSTSAHKELVSLGMYGSSLASCCPYSSAYTCTFALRRGVNPDKLRIQAVCTRHGDTSALYTAEETTVIDVSERLAIYPCKVTNEDRRKLRELTGSPETAEAIVLGTAMMGFMGKSMDGLGVPLEVEAYRETREILGDTWSPGATNGQLVNPDVHTPGSLPPMDSQTTYAAMMEEGPGAASYVAKVMADIPTNADEATAFLIERYGYGFPVLKSMHLNRPMTAVACMVHECFNPETSVIGMKTKLGVAQVFAAINESKPVQEAVNAIAKHFGVAQDFLDLVKELGSEGDAIRAAKRLFATNEDTRMQALLIIGHATSFAPTRVDEDLVMLCEDAKLTPPSIVEAVTVVSVMQMLHRISMYYIDDEVEKP